MAVRRFLVTGGACLRVYSATASSFEVVSYFYELDIHIFSRPVDSLFFLVGVLSSEFRFP